MVWKLSTLLLAAASVAGSFDRSAAAQIRVANWNVTLYEGGRVADFGNSIYGEFQGRRFLPDILVAQEIDGSAGASAFLAILNNWPDGPRDWALAPFIPNSSNPGANPGNALYYRTSKVALVGSPVTLSAGTGPCSTCPPRDNQRYRVRLVGYSSAAAEMYIYSAHFKAGSTSADQARRTPEAARLRADTATLPAGANFLLAGDFNIQSSAQTAYQTLVSTPETGRFFDPINSPGNWNNNCAFRWVHTQDPAVGGQIDDRHDQILLSATLRDGAGLDYVGSRTSSYNDWALVNSSWDDPNHSYRSWGNDGGSCVTSGGNQLRVVGNTMVGAAIAQDLMDSAAGGGHLPVYLDLRVPAKSQAPTALDFGDVPQGAAALASLQVANAIDVARFHHPHAQPGGLQPLLYTLAAAAPFAAPAGSFSAAAGGAGNAHTITLESRGLPLGPVEATLTLASSDVDAPQRTIRLRATIVPAVPCSPADIVAIGGFPPPDGELTVDDYTSFINAFAAGDPLADIVSIGGFPPPDGEPTVDDFTSFINAFAEGCG